MVAKGIQKICFYGELWPLFEESSLLPWEFFLLLKFFLKNFICSLSNFFCSSNKLLPCSLRHMATLGEEPCYL
jgi:hypothetical protein